MTIFIYSVTGTKEVGANTVNHQCEYGYLEASSKDEALGKAVTLFTDRHKGYSIFLHAVFETDLVKPTTAQEAAT